MKTLLLLFLFPLSVLAQLEMPTIFSDHMVLQRQQPIQVWGKGLTGETVTVTFKNQTATVEVDAAGNWRLALEPEDASFDPAVLQVTDGHKTLNFEDVLVGEVWLCSGQSNMGYSVSRSKDADLEVPMANISSIRMYKVKPLTATSPRFSSDAAWELCRPETAAHFSAVGYYFGRDIQAMLGVPVGLVQASWGGTPAIAWTRAEAFPKHPLLMERAGEWENYVDTYDEKLAAWEEELEAWMKRKNLALYVRDPGISVEAETWHQAALNDFNWGNISLPAEIEKEIGEMDGAVWFRRRIELPVALRGQDLVLALGPIADYDHTWVNGVLVGKTGGEHARPHTVDRRYEIPAKLTQSGELTLAVRVFDRASTGGFLGEAKSMLLIGGSSAIRLAGPGWKYKVESKLERSVANLQLNQYPDAPKRPPEPDSPHRPASLANGMLATVAPYSMRGAIWYQGENDTHWEPAQYGERLKVMFEDWREWWGNPEFQLGIVQLANFMQPRQEPSDDPWPHVRESQRVAARDLPGAGLVVTIDLGEANDIHPRNKQEVGRRLARWALSDVYGKDVLGGGPVLTRVRFLPGRIVLTYDRTGGGLHIQDGTELGGFTVAGADGEFFPASARIDGQQNVVVTSEQVPDPVKLRYGWQNNPVGANLANREGLPASPFHVEIPAAAE